jgi:outer membrane receptor protein involved in Fe transport
MGTTLFLLSTALASGTALAQSADPSNATTPANGDIIVTAEKRSERISLTPLSMTALSAKNLEALGATQFRDFANTIPGLGFTTTGVGQTQINLRGITTGGNISPTTGVYVDDVPYGSSTPYAAGAQLALDVGLFDLDRIEVLRGPQGTLYGASTEGGLIKYVTVAPDLENFGGLVRSGVSDTRDGGISYDGAAVVNAPIVTDKVAVRASGFYSHDGGYIDNIGLDRNNVNRSKVYGGRGELLLKPVDDLTIRLTGFAQNVQRSGDGTADYNLAISTPVDGSLNQDRVLPESFSEHFRLGSGTVDYDAGFAKLTSISSYQFVETHAFSDLSKLYVPYLALLAGIDADAVGLQKDNRTRKFTEEVRLAGTVGPLDWLVGGFYTHESSLQYQNVPIFGGPIASLEAVELPTKFQEYAGFGNLTYHITPKLDLTGGVRYAHNDQSSEQIGLGSLPSVALRHSHDNVATWLANARYRPSENVMTYFRYATGYRPGGPNIVANGADGQPLAPPTFAPDKLQSYEVGLKANTADHSFSVDGALYLINWDNLQVNAVRDALGVIANASSARSKGAELTLTARPTQGLSFVGAFAYTDAKLTAAAPDVGGAKGDRLPDTPKFTAAINGDYEFPIADVKGFVGGTIRYIGKRVSSFPLNPGSPLYNLPDYTSVDARLGVEVSRFRVEAYLRNMFDVRGQLSANTAYSILGGPAQVSILQPRTVGLSVTARY